MSFKDPRNCLFSLKAWGKLKKAPPGFVGIYQRMPTSKGQIVRRLKIYSPTNPQTEAQQANRSKFADAVLAWQNLTEGEKDVYNEEAKGRPLHGYHLFIRQYLKSH